MLAIKNITPQTCRRRNTPPSAVLRRQRHRRLPFVGTPDRVAEELAHISQAGVRGIALSFVNYLQELPYFCDEVLPRLARLGTRAKH